MIIRALCPKAKLVIVWVISSAVKDSSTKMTPIFRAKRAFPLSKLITNIKTQKPNIPLKLVKAKEAVSFAVIMFLKAWMSRSKTSTTNSRILQDSRAKILHSKI